jgi:hypothetical protein
MRAFLGAVAACGLVAAAARVGFGQAKPSSPLSIEGVWKATSVIVTGARMLLTPSRIGSPTSTSELKFEGNNTMVQITKSTDGKSETRRTYTRLE